MCTGTDEVINLTHGVIHTARFLGINISMEWKGGNRFPLKKILRRTRTLKVQMYGFKDMVGIRTVDNQETNWLNSKMTKQ